MNVWKKDDHTVHITAFSRHVGGPEILWFLYAHFSVPHVFEKGELARITPLIMDRSIHPYEILESLGELLSNAPHWRPRSTPTPQDEKGEWQLILEKTSPS